MGKNAKYQRLIRQKLQELPELRQPVKVGMTKSGQWIVDNLTSAQQTAMLNSLGIAQFALKERYTYTIEIPQEINHKKNMLSVYKKFGIKGIYEYCNAVMQKDRELEAERHFKSKNKWYRAWLRNLLKPHVLVKKMGLLVVGKLNGFITNLRSSVSGAMRSGKVKSEKSTGN